MHFWQNPDFPKHGFSEKCPGCKAVLRNTTRQGHTAECRARLTKEMADEEKVKVAQRKEMEFYERVHKDMEKKIEGKGEAVPEEASSSKRNL